MRISDWSSDVCSSDLSRLAFLLIVMIVFAILGCFMEGLGMIAIIVPVIFPSLTALGVDPIWFGVFVVILVELGQLTPPLGVVLFVVASCSDDVKVEDVVMGTVPFFGIILAFMRSEEHTSELQSLMRISYPVFCLKKKK